MPRGRPPKDRTKEEAINARKEQVRKNVQAFRKRQRLRKQPEIGTSHDDEEILSDNHGGDLLESGFPGHWVNNYRYLVNKDGSEADYSASVRSNIVTSPGIDQPAVLRTRLIPEISYSKLSRQQFVSNCVLAFKPASKLKTGPHWAETLPEVVNKDSALDLSIQAICFMQLGNVKSERWLLEEGGSYYGRALQSLSRRLPADKDFREEVLMAMTALSVYELFQGTNSVRNGWLIHYQAAFKYLKQLLAARNGWVPNNQPMFHFLEALCVFDALGSRRPSYFSTSEAWSRSLDRWAGETYRPLLGLMTSVPAILQAHDYLLKIYPSSTVSFSSRSELLEQCFRLEDRFLEWHRHTSQHLPNFTPTTSETFNGDMKLSFPNLFIARLHLLYWSALVLLQETITSLFSYMHTASDNNSSDDTFCPPPSLRTPILLHDSLAKSHNHALSIRRSVSFCLDPDNGIVGKSMLLLPIWVARSYFSNMGNVVEAERCTNVLASLGQQHLDFGVVGDEGGEVEGEGMEVHWREGGLAAMDGRKEISEIRTYSI